MADTKERFRVAFLMRGQIDNEEYAATMAEVKHILARVKHSSPNYLKGFKPYDIRIEDRKTNKEYSVSPNFKLVEM